MEFTTEVELNGDTVAVTVFAEFDDFFREERPMADEERWWITEVLTHRGDDVMNQLTRDEIQRLERLAVDQSRRDFDEIFAPDHHPGNNYLY